MAGRAGSRLCGTATLVPDQRALCTRHSRHVVQRSQDARQFEVRGNGNRTVHAGPPSPPIFAIATDATSGLQNTNDGAGTVNAQPDQELFQRSSC